MTKLYDRIPISTRNTQRIIFYLSIFLLIGGGLFLFHSLLTPFVLSFVLAWLLDPICTRMERYLYNRILCSLILSFGFLTALVFLLFFTLPSLFQEGLAFVKLLPELSENLLKQVLPVFQKYQIFLEPIMNESFEPKNMSELFQEFSHRTAMMFTQNLSNIIHYLSSLFGVMSLFLITPITTFYLLKDWDMICKKLASQIPENEKYLLVLWKKIDKALAAIVRGQFIVASLMAVFYALLLTLIGLPFGFPIGIFAGISMVIPYVGSIAGLLTALLTSLVYYSFDIHLVIIGGVFALGQLIESYFLTPRMVGEKVGLHPVWIIFLIFAGAHIGGIVGVFLAIPTGAILRVLALHLREGGIEDR